MPDRRTHLPIGAIAGLGTVLLLSEQTPEAYRAIELVTGAIGGALGGAMPDVLEPASSPHHRSVLHGVVVGGAGGVGLFMHLRGKCHGAAAECRSRAALLPVGCEARQTQERNAMLWHALAGLAVGFAAGYASHLLLDAGTPASIPLVVRGF